MSSEKIAQIRCIDGINYNIGKLKFLGEAVACWNSNISDFNEDLRIGFGCILEDTIKAIEEEIKLLEENE